MQSVPAVGQSGFDGFSIEYLREQESANMPARHYHEQYEIYYQLSGERVYFIEDRVYRVNAGDLVLVNIHDLHKTMAAGTPKYGRILLAFGPDFLPETSDFARDVDLLACFTGPRRVLTLSVAQQTTVEGILFGLIDETRRQAPGLRTGLQLGVMQLLLFATRQVAQAAGPGAAVSPLHERISQAAQYIANNYAQALSLRSVAERFHFSYYYFCRVFKEVTRFTLTEYVHNVRVRRAQQLLRETRLPITRVADMVGFDSCTHFERVFKSLTHLTPAEYRRRSAG